MFVLFLYLLAVLTLASGKPILLPRLAQDATQDVAQPSFDVTIESLGNSSIKAHVTNSGADGVRLVQRGGVLDRAPTKKVTVTGGDTDPTFTGVRVEYILSHLTADGFVEVSPKQTVATVFDVADFYDLTPGQEYTAVSKGHLEYTTLTDEKKFHEYRYESNEITFTAPADLANRLEGRSTLQCSDDNYNQLVQSAISRAAEMATAAAKDARTGSDLLQKFFKSTSEDVKDNVAGRLDAIAKEATTTGQLTYYCKPTEDDYCAGNVAAMTYPTLNRVVNCPGYYESTETSNYCGYLDQAGITLHEYAHATALYAPGTEDVAYGYDNVLSLDTDDSLNNADNFAYYASAVYLQCAADDSVTVGTAIDVGIGAGGSSGGSSGDDSGSGTTTITQTPTATPGPTSTPGPTGGDDSGSGDDNGTGTGGGSDWPWGGDSDGNSDGTGIGIGWGQGQNGGGDDSNTNSNSGSDSGTNSGDSGSWDKGTSTSTNNDGGSSTVTITTPTTSPVTTSSGDNLYNLQDFINWLTANYGGQGKSQGQGQIDGQTKSETTKTADGSTITVSTSTDSGDNAGTNSKGGAEAEVEQGGGAAATGSGNQAAQGAEEDCDDSQ